MRENSENLLQEVEETFSQAPSANQKAWSMIHDFYHFVLTHMEEQKISKADLAKTLGRSRSAISQMFNKTPNITIRKMSEIASAVGLDISIVPSSLKKEMGSRKESHYIYKIVHLRGYTQRELEEKTTKIDGSRISISCNRFQAYEKSLNRASAI